MDEDLAFLPAWELRQLIATKQVSPVEITELYFKRIETLDSHLNCYLTLNHDEAMETAQRAEEAVARGEALGPLHGLPISIKDIEISKGIRTTSGSLAFKDRVPDEDSIVVERVRKAGAIVLGKTNTPEFGMLGATENRLGDHCRNPWDTERTAGGSSGGAAAGTVAGLCSLATGSDGGGSVRIPASFCGVYGIKPTQGRVPRYSGASAAPIGNYTGQPGPLTRTVRDSAMLLQVLAGYDARDATSLRETPPDLLAAVDRDITGLRIAWSPDYGHATVDPEVAEGASKAASVFEELGCSVEEIDFPVESPFEIWWTLSCANSYASNGDLLASRADELTWYAREALEYGATVTGAAFTRAMGRMDQVKAQMADLFEKYDLLLSPTMPSTAMPVGQYPEGIGDTEAQPGYWRFLPFTHPINIAGHAAASVPCGFSSDGMPIGLHVVGPRGGEGTIIAASAAFERARPWAQKKPPVS